MNTILVEEKPLDPQRPIIDPHVHLWDISTGIASMQIPQRFLLPELLETIQRSGHNITHTIFVECHAMYRASGSEEFRSLGETEFANGIAAMSASDNYGPCRVAHRIVGTVDLLLGASVARVLDAHIAVAGERFRGIRFNSAYSETGLFGWSCSPQLRGIMLDSRFRKGAKVLAQKGLALDIWCLHSQLDELISLTDAIPNLTIILNHLGTPEDNGAFAGNDQLIREAWAKRIRLLAQHKNVLIKLGGLGMDISRPFGSVIDSFSSETLAQCWRPYIETCIDAFTPARCMFESNFPSDGAVGSYGVIWNAFKRITQSFTEHEKDRLFYRTAADAYQIA